MFGPVQRPSPLAKAAVRNSAAPAAGSPSNVKRSTQNFKIGNCLADATNCRADAFSYAGRPRQIAYSSRSLYGKAAINCLFVALTIREGRDKLPISRVHYTGR